MPGQNFAQVTVSSPVGPLVLTLNGLQAGGWLEITFDSAPLGTAPRQAQLLPTHVSIANNGVRFSSALVCAPYSDREVATAGIAEPSIRLWRLTGGAWTNISGPIGPDLANNRICGQTESFSTFAVGSGGVYQTFLPAVVTGGG